MWDTSCLFPFILLFHFRNKKRRIKENDITSFYSVFIFYRKFPIHQGLFGLSINLHLTKAPLL